MNRKTEEEIAYALLAEGTIGRGDQAVDSLNKNYQFFIEKGYSPIAAAVLSRRSGAYQGAREDLIKFYETFKGLNKRLKNS